MGQQNEEFKKLDQEFFNYLLTLKKKKAYYSVFLLSDIYISLGKQFTVDVDEYTYLIDKYRNSELTDFDLSRKEITIYLKNMIEKLESIFKQNIDVNEIQFNNFTYREIEDNLKNSLNNYPELLKIYTDIQEEETIPTEIILKNKVEDIRNMLVKTESIENLEKGDNLEEKFSVLSLKNFSYQEKIPKYEKKK